MTCLGATTGRQKTEVDERGRESVSGSLNDKERELNDKGR
jgi:hypothetical protein